MWRVPFLKFLIGLNFAVAGLSSSFLIYTHGNFWKGTTYHLADEELGYTENQVDGHIKELEKKRLDLKEKYVKITYPSEHIGRIAWFTATVFPFFTASGLKFIFPSFRKLMVEKYSAEPSKILSETNSRDTTIKS